MKTSLFGTEDVVVTTMPEYVIGRDESTDKHVPESEEVVSVEYEGMQKVIRTEGADGEGEEGEEGDGGGGEDSEGEKSLPSIISSDTHECVCGAEFDSDVSLKAHQATCEEHKEAE